jgi:peptidoglycan/xylan/chitin deacetylase (PgdA/CDA1 family)
MSTGQVVFSLDFELGWGHRETRPAYVDELRARGSLVRERITELIELFERYDIPATWAVVGKLVEPGEDPMFHAPDLFETLLDSQPDHEIGLHSYAHKFYNRLSEPDAREDLKLGIDSLAEWGIQTCSFVFPQNKINHVNLLNNMDVECYRGGKRDLKSSFPQGILNPETFARSVTRSEPIYVPVSMYLAARRPKWYRRWYAHLGLKTAVRRGEMIHYWLHPHNIITDDKLFSGIELLLKKVKCLKSARQLEIKTMSEVATQYRD